MRLETIHPKELGADALGQWRAHQRAEASLQSPYLTPDWAQLVGFVRDDGYKDNNEACEQIQVKRFFRHDKTVTPQMQLFAITSTVAG